MTARPINLEAENIRFGENCTGGNKFQKKLNFREPCSSHRVLDDSEENTFSEQFAHAAFRASPMNLRSRLTAHMLKQFSASGTHRNVCSSHRFLDYFVLALRFAEVPTLAVLSKHCKSMLQIDRLRFLKKVPIFYPSRVKWNVTKINDFVEFRKSSESLIFAYVFKVLRYA